jgi:hypothetical protein
LFKILERGEVFAENLMENYRPLDAVRPARVRLLGHQSLCLEPTAGELPADASSRSKQFYFQLNNIYNHSAEWHNDYSTRRGYNNRDYCYRNYNSHSVIVGSRSKQHSQPAAGELHSDARSLHSYNDFHDDYRDDWNCYYRNNYYWNYYYWNYYYRNGWNCHYRNDDYRRRSNSFVINGGGQPRRPVAGDLYPHAGSIHTDYCPGYYHNDYRDDRWNYRDDWSNRNRTARAACSLKPDGR